MKLWVSDPVNFCIPHKETFEDFKEAVHGHMVKVYEFNFEVLSDGINKQSDKYVNEISTQIVVNL